VPSSLQKPGPGVTIVTPAVALMRVEGALTHVSLLVLVAVRLEVGPV
jgi:hypothetical protein